jgi:hypothetical protein
VQLINVRWILEVVGGGDAGCVDVWSSAGGGGQLARG